MRNLTVGLCLLMFVPTACGDDPSTGDDGTDAGAGGNAAVGGTAGTDTGGAGAGARGGSSGASGTSSGGTFGGEGGDAGEGTTGGSGAVGGEDGGGEAGMAGDAGMGGSVAGGGMAGGGMAGGGMAGGGMAGGGMAGGGMAGGGMAGGGMAGGGMAGAGTGGGGTAGAGGTTCNDTPLRCSLGTCPSGTSLAVYSANGLPVSIPDNAPANPAFATIAIATPGLVARIAVQTNITHVFDGDVDMSLVTPYGARELSSDNGSAGDNYADTVFSDNAATAITAGAPPFTGTFRPEQDLTTLSGAPLSGSYRLRVADDQPEDTGQITSFSIGVCQCLASSGQCEFGLACQNGVDDDGDALIDCQEATCASSPGCPKPESACGDTSDNDGDNLVDCADPSCAWACTALGSACSGANRIFAYGPTNLPQTLPQAGAARFPAPIFSASGGSVVRAAVRFNATHTYVSDLVLTLSSPAGTQRVLTSANGGQGDDYINTVFIDSALGVIGTTGYDTAPFTGNYGPEEPFSAWDGQSALGIWQGELADVETGDGGSFTELSLALCVAP